VSERLDRARSYHEAIREVLLREWDPIGVNDIPEAQDEYDSYVGQVYALLIRRTPASKILDLLWGIETEHMGLSGNRQHTAQIAERLAALPSELEGST
jgi:hypothetical protein